MLNASDPDAGNAPATENALSQAHLIAPRSLVTQAMRESCQTHRGMVFWLTGLSGSGKSTLAHSVEARQGLIAHFTGISAGYDVPAQPDRAVSTERRPEEESIDELLSYIISQTAR